MLPDFLAGIAAAAKSSQNPRDNIECCNYFLGILFALNRLFAGG
jgi:hypothetical protein